MFDTVFHHREKVGILLAIELGIYTQTLKWCNTERGQFLVCVCVSLCERVAAMGHAPSVEVLDLISAALLLMRGLQGHSSAVQHEPLRALLEKATDALVTYRRLDHKRIRCVKRVPDAWQSLHL